MNEQNNGACSEYEPKLEDYLSGQLSSADAKNVTEHVRGCHDCRLALEDATASVRLLRMAESTGDPGPAFARIVMARIASERDAASDGRGMWQPFVALAWRFAATATLALALMVTYDVAWHQQTPEATVASVRSTEIHDLFTTEADRVPVNRDDVLLVVAEANHAKQ